METQNERSTDALVKEELFAARAKLAGVGNGGEPESEHLLLVSKIWEEILGIQGIPKDANFFDIGGHSLLALDICSKIQKATGKKFGIKEMAKAPTIASLARLIDETQEPSQDRATRGASKGAKEAELTLNQFQTWYQEQIHPGSSLHLLAYVLELQEDIERKRLEDAYRQLVEKRQALRLTIGPGPIQIEIDPKEVFEKCRPVFIEVDDKEESYALMRKEARKPFDLNGGPLFESAVYKTKQGQVFLFHRFHHIIFDGWSSELFFSDLAKAYRGDELAPEKANFLDYAVWHKQFLESREGRECLAASTQMFEKIPEPLDMPLDYPRPPKANSSSKEIPFEITGELLKSARHWSAKNGISLFSMLLGCFQKTLLDYSGQEETATAIALRGRPEDQLDTIGFFTNAAAVRARKISNVLDYFRNVAGQGHDALDREMVPFEKLREALKAPRDPSRSVLAQSFFSYQDTSSRPQLFYKESYVRKRLGKRDIHTELDLWIEAENGKAVGGLEYRTDLFRAISVKRILRHFFDTLEWVCSGKGLRWEEFMAPSAFELAKKTNPSKLDFKYRGSVANFVDSIAARKPNSIAVSAGGSEMTYRELSKKSSKMAARLRSKNVGPGDLIGIALKRDANLLVAALGTMKAGAGYVPLDPSFPKERLSYMVKQSGLGLILLNKESKRLFGDGEARLDCIEDIELEKEEEFSMVPSPADPAYVIYTSGSTGRPKGVSISHGAMMNFLEASLEKPGLGPGDRLLAVTTFCFDISVLELYLPLMAGGETVLASKEETIDGEALRKTIENKRINVLQATPPSWRILLASGWRGGRDFKVLCGGEAFPKDLIEALSPNCSSVWNMYGPTETTVWASCKKMGPGQTHVSIGRPMKNYRMYILDERLAPVPFGAVGELYIAGAGLALGYRNREDLTQERFVEDTVYKDGKMYKTGDLARFLPNGEIECLGRNDDQVKVRGYRIELGEIQSVLSEKEDIRQALVMAREDRPGDVRLVAYIQLCVGAQTDMFQIRKYLSPKIPSYMIPANFIFLEKFPLTLTGKVDKKRLPAVNYYAENAQVCRRNGGGQEAAGNIEARLARLWMENTGAQDYDLEDDYFEVGGNSLLSVDLFSSIDKEFKVDLPLSALIANSQFKGVLDAVTKQVESRTSSKAINLHIPAADAEQKKNIKTLAVFDPPEICSSIVVFKKSGGKIPVFCFHGVGGNVLNYIKMAPVFKDRPFFGVQSQGVDGKSEPLRSVDDMATRYMEEIRLVQPSGPYLLAGGSMGGMLAFETARKLREAGEEVKSVLMFDTYGPGCDFTGYKGSRLKDLGYSAGWNAKRLWVSLQRKLFGIFGLSVSHKIRHFYIETLNYQALWRHQCGSYDGRIDLIRGPEENNGWRGKEDMGWRKVAKGELNLHFVKGRHETFVESKQFNEVLANVLNSY